MRLLGESAISGVAGEGVEDEGAVLIVGGMERERSRGRGWRVFNEVGEVAGGEMGDCGPRASG